MSRSVGKRLEVGPTQQFERWNRPIKPGRGPGASWMLDASIAAGGCSASTCEVKLPDWASNERLGARFSSAATGIRTNHRVCIPVWLEAIGQVGVKGGAGGRGVLVVAARWAITCLRLRHEPVPVEHRDVFVLAGLGMPPEQVVMVGANLTGAVMVANIVKIRLGKRHAEETQGQKYDPESS